MPNLPPLQFTSSHRRRFTTVECVVTVPISCPCYCTVWRSPCQLSPSDPGQGPCCRAGSNLFNTTPTKAGAAAGGGGEAARFHRQTPELSSSPSLLILVAFKGKGTAYPSGDWELLTPICVPLLKQCASEGLKGQENSNKDSKLKLRLAERW